MAERYSIDQKMALQTGVSIISYEADNATSLRRAVVYDLSFGSPSTPSDDSCELEVNRFTTTGTAENTLTPANLDPNGQAALGVAKGNFGHTDGVEPSGGGETLLAKSFHMRGAPRWVASPGGELIIPATDGSGLNVLCVNRTSVFDLAATVHFEE